MMGITPLQVCMDSSDWLQGTIHHHEDNTGILDSSSPLSPPSGHEDMLACSRPLIERRLRPPHEQSLKCPRCESTHTKFCYYNNYSLSQPRYFCKTCRRYWTKGGTLRNIPVGGGCRKNKKQSISNSKKSSNNESSATSSAPLILNHQNGGPFTSLPAALSYHNNNEGFPDFSSFSLFGGASNGNFSIENHAPPIDFMENKYEALVGGSHNFMGNENFGGLMGAQYHNSHGLTSQFGLAQARLSAEFLDHENFNTTGINILESCQRLMIPHENQVQVQVHHQNLDHHQNNYEMQDVKPNGKILSLEWHDHQAGKEQFGYNFGGLGPWTGLMNGSYGSSATNLGV